MGRRSRLSQEEKIEAVRLYQSGTKRTHEILDVYGISKTVLLEWVRMVEVHGTEVLVPKSRNASYTKDFKQKVVYEYLNGEGSYHDLAVKHRIPSNNTIKNWVSRYNGHKELRDYDPKGAVYMTPKRKTTLEERLEIVRYCLDHQRAYKLAAEQYEVAYAQVYQWVMKYETHGEVGLKDGRGHRKDPEQLSELERLKRENERLRHQLELKERETILLKKVKEFERRPYSPKSDKNRNT